MTGSVVCATSGQVTLTSLSKVLFLVPREATVFFQTELSSEAKAMVIN